MSVQIMCIALVVLLQVLMFACGSDPKDEQAATARTPEIVPVDKTPVPVQGAPVSAPEYHSLAVADATALPECKKEAEGWLVYLKAEAIFKVCSSGEWSTIEIGPPAKEELGPNQYRDPMTNLLWFASATGAHSTDNIPAHCGSAWRLPTKDELIKLSQDTNTFGKSYAWADDLTTIVRMDGYIPKPEDVGGYAQVLCVKKE